MKTEQLTAMFIACLFMAAGCSKIDGPNYQGSNNDVGMLKKVPMSQVFTIEPSGGDDTDAFVQAFYNAKEAGHGSVIQLCEGQYRLGFIEIRDFYGSLKGAGKGKTIITAMDNLEVSPLLARGLFPDLIKFVGGDVHLSHFTIRTPPGKISVGGPGKGNIASLLNLSANNSDYEPLNEERSINVIIDNICFQGQRLEAGEGYEGYVYNYNCAFALHTSGDYYQWYGDPVPRQKVDIIITNSEFETFCYGVVLEDIKNSQLVVGEKNKGNTFSNLDRAGGVWEGRDNEIIVTGNTFNIPAYSWGFAVDDYPYYSYLKNEPPQKPSLIDISHNVFNMEYADYGLFIRNILNYYYGHIPMAIQVKNNLFTMEDGWEWAVRSDFTVGMVIRNNKFGGHGDWALVMANYSKKGLVLGNNFSTASFESGVAYLTPSTENWTLVGGNMLDRVVNLGVDNVITGMNMSTSDVPLGRRISESISTMNHLINW
jgi:hypothetical protein